MPFKVSARYRAADIVYGHELHIFWLFWSVRSPCVFLLL